jgi:hypothetical protein
MIDAARAVVRAESLRDNAFAAERARLLEYDGAVTVIVLVEDNAVTVPLQQTG